VRSTFFLVLLLNVFIFFGCAREDGPSLKVLNQRCAQGKIAGEYLVQTSDGKIKKMYASSAEDLLNQTSALGLEVESIDYNFKHSTELFSRLRRDEPENRVGFGQYGQELIGASNLWRQGIFGRGVTVAVIDTGLDIDNKFFKSQVFVNEKELGNDEDGNGLVNDLNGWDFVNSKPLTRDLQRHGTEVSSVIVAEHLNGLRIGVAPEATLLPIAALIPSEDGSDASASSDLLVKAVDYARRMNVDIINASWGGNGCSTFLRSSVEKATNNDILFVTSAGNDNENIDVNLEFPSSFTLPFVISVGGIDAAGQKVRSSNFGSRVNFFAPGGDILTVISGGDNNLAFTTGTSIAAPFISGSLALLKSALPSASNEEVLRALNLSSDESRIPNLEQALKELN